MRGASRILILVLLVGVSGLGACRQGDGAPANPPPDARRPVLESEADLASKRQQRIESGDVVPTESPVIQAADRTRPAPRPLPRPIEPTPGAIEADILIVNDRAITSAEVLFPLWEDLAELRRTQTIVGFRSQASRMIVDEVRREIGSLLVYDEAMGRLGDDQLKQLSAAVDKQIEDLITKEHGGSKARFEAAIIERGLTVEQYRERTQRQMVVFSYTREKLLPQVQLTRAELLTYYHEHQSEFSKPETRELLIMEFPFEAYLPEGQTWERSTRAARGRAKVQAVRDARAAYAKLESTSFEDVAREYSKGLHADDGGSWGMIGRPLQAPYDVASGMAFEFAEGQVSEPLETDTGWYIVKCGRIEEATRRSFAEAQSEIRKLLTDERFARQSTRYILGLAESATFSSLDSFVMATVRKAEEGTNDEFGADRNSPPPPPRRARPS
jgi:hypothetical protein